MINKGISVHYLVACLVITLMTMVVACSSGTQTEVTQVSQAIEETKTSEPITQETEVPPTQVVSTPTLTSIYVPTLLPSPSLTDTVTPASTISPLQKIGELPTSGFPSPNLEITADGTLLAISAGGDEDTLYVFDMITQTVRWRIVEDDTGGTTGYSSLTFSPDGHYLAAWDNGYSLFVWDMDSGELVYQMRFERDADVNVQSVSFSPDGQLLALSSLNVPVFIYSMATGELVDRFPSPNIVTYPPTDNDNHFLKPGHHYGEIWEVEFVPNHTNLLAITVFPDPFAEGEGVTGGLYFWDMETQHLLSVLPGRGGSSMAVSLNGQFLVTKIDRQLVGWDVPNNRETFTITNIESDTALISITDNGFFATLSHTVGLTIWNFSGELIATLNPDKPIGDMVFTPDGRLLITYSGDENSPIEIWELNE